MSDADAAPEISVILPFYNNAATVEASVRSVLHQTFSDFELILIDDGSTDDSLDLVARIKDPRIILHRMPQNAGVSAARNEGMRLMRGKFMAPMDADDVCRPERLEWTWRRLQQEPGLGGCGGLAKWCGWGTVPYVLALPLEPETVRAYLCLGVPFHHDTLLFRTSVIWEHQLEYPENFQGAVDYGFFRAYINCASVANLPKVLVRYQFSPQGISKSKTDEIYSRRLQGLKEELAMIGIYNVDAATLEKHAHIGNGGGAKTARELVEFLDWLNRLRDMNQQKGFHAGWAMDKTLAMAWFRVCRNSAHLGWTVFQAWRRVPWHAAYRPSFGEWCSFAGSWMFSVLSPNHRIPQGGILGQ